LAITTLRCSGRAFEEVITDNGKKRKKVKKKIDKFGAFRYYPLLSLHLGEAKIWSLKTK